jgi:YebC/PmpR family DNA-binding regulatory protein
MAGHNKWSKVKRLKGALDQKRGKLFSKLAKEITVAARAGGGDVSANPRLRSAVLAARAQSMPNDNITRAIQRGTGDGAARATYEEFLYEGYAPGGVAILIEVATDNKNRTVADLRLIFSKNAGNLAATGAVGYLFKRKGQITVPRDALAEDRIFELALEAGAEDVNSDDEHFVIITAHDQLYAVAEALKTAGVVTDLQGLTYIPETTLHIGDPHTAAQVIRLCEALEENDDVQSVHANFEVPEEVLAKVSP